MDEKLKKYMTNTDKNVFVLRNLPEVVKGALFSRYSRSSKSLRDVLREEFLEEEIKQGKAEAFYDRVLVGYGDDSIAELGGVHVAIEKVSILATKEIEDARIGISPLEKSTRYVFFDKKEEGKWQYYRDPEIMSSELREVYLEACDKAFETYAALIPQIEKYVMENNPRGEESERAYKSTIRAKTCDILRGLLPAATLTNMGLYGNGRAMEYLLIKMYANPLPEVRSLAAQMEEELKKEIPSFIKRANNEKGKMFQEYLKGVREEMEGEGVKAERGGEYVELVECRGGVKEVLAAALYPYSHAPYAQIIRRVEEMSEEERREVIRKYCGERKNRRHKPGRAFEHVEYLFDICANFGAYRDLQRHRILTQQKQRLTPYLGFKLPQETIDAGFEKEFKEAMEVSKNAYEEISKKYIYQAQYVVCLAYNIRWYMKLNLREAYHLIELRSSRQGHPDYRKIVQEMYRKIKEVHPELVEAMKFVDLSEYKLERLEAEKRIDKKMEEWKKKYG